MHGDILRISFPKRCHAIKTMIIGRENKILRLLMASRPSQKQAILLHMVALKINMHYDAIISKLSLFTLMDKEEKSSQWKTAFIGFLGAVLGGVIVFGGTLLVWHFQEGYATEQQVLEQHNIASALYYDVSNIENKFNSSMQKFSSFTKNDTRIVDEPNFIYYAIGEYYSINLNYNTFGKDMLRFGGNTSTDLYEFYTNLAEINDFMPVVYQTAVRLENGELVNPANKATAHTYSIILFKTKIPDGIRLAEKIKKELKPYIE